jgi:hypothetical protein
MKQNLSDNLPEVIHIPEDARIITSTPEEREQNDISKLPPPPPEITIL